jgi:serine/threonine-protein kinase PpkA
MIKQGLGRLLAGVLALGLFVALGGGWATAQGRQPELMEGKKTLFKRVIVRPGATLFPAAADQGGAPMPAFSVLYVYGKSGDFVEVGKTIGAVDGFVKGDRLIEWKQTIVAVFNPNRANRERSLLFKSPEVIDAVIRDPNPREKLAQLRADAAAGRPGDGSVLAIEPDTPPDIRQNFYFFPILSVTNKRLPQRVDGRILQVASLSKIDQPPPPPPDRKRTLADMRVGVVFVIDTTMSMGPYIDKVREAMTRVQARLDRTPAGQNMRFGLIGFRQSLADNTPGVEYHVKTFLKLGKESTAAAFVKAIADVKESPVSTKGFNEDSLGGVYEALSTGDWKDFDAKFVVLVTDAGPLLPESGRMLRAPGLGPAQIQRKAAEDGIAITVLHLLTAEGASDHASARGQYQILSRSGEGSSYFNVTEGALDRFTQGLDSMADGIISRTEALAAGDTNRPAPTGNPIRDAIERNFYAMQLAYLGRREGSRAPDMFEAYLADRDLSDPTKEATEIRLFLTKNQLATMHDVAQRIVEAGERSTVDPTLFFSQLRRAIATMARDPNRPVNTQPETLGAALGEFLEGLPYAQASPILSIDSQMWVQMGAARQQEIRIDLQRKLKFFEVWHNTPDNWVPLNRGAPEGEKVTAFPLSQLP